MNELPALTGYFAQYLSIDIALDPFPYPGGTTTCDALWMGVPTVSLVGTAGFTRSGLTILSNAGLGYLATESEARYLQTAIELASDLPRLAELRSTTRERLNSSPLMDGLVSRATLKHATDHYGNPGARGCESHSCHEER